MQVILVGFDVEPSIGGIVGSALGERVVDVTKAMLAATTMDGEMRRSPSKAAIDYDATKGRIRIIGKPPAQALDRIQFLDCALKVRSYRLESAFPKLGLVDVVKLASRTVSPLGLDLNKPIIFGLVGGCT